ncbi:uncharacterized protein K452DRAFT_322332 [Aplosporella prunicola CBS 121167]|uniref:3-phytase n=1 Tax=Aplosporella prunicola CBS 121167 TaxID=1176127 RepID=A0A6A6AZE8_9PEZI|nr:uncharacterized protein K452DRAFT_322332 [Aplosporella prunicola CBS 121167]KAF2136563.1 hypothetical protein K452DRAFT_322332 [Aplosporella prunicola CBS 121167]
MVSTSRNLVLAAAALCLTSSGVNAAAIEARRTASSSDVPQHFQTSPELFAGPTETGQAPFLAETNAAPFPSVSYIPPQPLETQVPIAGNKHNGNVFQHMGELSHYFPSPDGFGVDEFALPPATNISALHMLHRHGARYPTSGTGAEKLGKRIADASGKFEATGKLAFLEGWEYKLGKEILVPIGKQELFDSGTQHYYQYGHLFPNNGSKIIARSTTQDRMTQSAEYFLTGFFGLGWTQNATLELIIEEDGYNNSLAGYHMCNNSNAGVNQGGLNATKQWAEIYLVNATERIKKQISGLDWELKDTYDAQSLCAYETVALGFSHFCSLFTYEEWLGYEYSVDLFFAGSNGFQAPTGRAVGIGYVQEILARLNHHVIDRPEAQINVTLDNNTLTFPLDQTINLDFSHDTNIMSILTAFGLTQFAPLMPADRYTPNRSLVVSHLEPFAARLDIEILQAPHPVQAKRPAVHADAEEYYDTSKGPMKYIHFVLNQRTVPLGASLEECGARDDGWCELETFLKVQQNSLDRSQYEWACFGDYPAVGYGNVTDGAPVAEELEDEL